jgi:two-component system, chemotaxis family, CheB/CheR fusion protein
MSQSPNYRAQSSMVHALHEYEIFEQVWHNTSDAMALSDAEGIVLAANPAYLRLYGFTLDEVIGKSFAIIFPEAVRESAVEQYKVVFSSAVTPAAYESVVRRADGTERIVDAKATFLTQAGKRVMMLSTIHDITDKKRHEVELLQLNKTLEARIAVRTAELEARQVELHALAAKLTLAEQEERRRISQILHDDLQQILYAIQMHTQFIFEDAKEHASGLHSNIRLVLDLLRNAIDKTRHLTVALSPPLLRGEGLVEALPWLVQQMEKTHGLHVDIHLVRPLRPLNQDMSVLLFQILRELLSNVYKHAKVDRATVEVQEEAGELLIRVSDDGQGFDPAAIQLEQAGSFGLLSIQERLRYFNGHMEIVSAPGQGTHVYIYLPTVAT